MVYQIGMATIQSLKSIAFGGVTGHLMTNVAMKQSLVSSATYIALHNITQSCLPKPSADQGTPLKRFKSMYLNINFILPHLVGMGGAAFITPKLTQVLFNKSFFKKPLTHNQSVSLASYSFASLCILPAGVAATSAAFE